jgi:mRNA interferase RelE/StbE
MAWIIDVRPKAAKELDKLDPQITKRILAFLHTRVTLLDDPRSIGEALSGSLKELWKYRVGDYRIICDIQDGIITILVLAIGNRKEVYRKHVN